MHCIPAGSESMPHCCGSGGLFLTLHLLQEQNQQILAGAIRQPPPPLGSRGSAMHGPGQATAGLWPPLVAAVPAALPAAAAASLPTPASAFRTAERVRAWVTPKAMRTRPKAIKPCSKCRCLNAPRDSDCTTAQAILFQCWTALSKQFFPSIQPIIPLAQLQAISSGSIT